MNPTEMSAAAIARAVAAGEIAAEEAVNAHLKRIKAFEPKIRAFITVLEQSALEQARAVDRKKAEGKPLGRLAGVPVAVKDNILIEGVEATCSSKILKGDRKSTRLNSSHSSIS